ncbi:MAG: hypothetical protein H6728_08320 [Myxococcales bacterium]|nr:hypothetical protein [Myxococcales bacterium]
MRSLRSPRRWLMLLGLSAAWLCTPLLAHAESQATLLPKQYLRAYDPISVVFRQDVGPKGGGNEDHGERYLRITPPTAGAYRWHDERTLEFRPVEAWSPLSRIIASVPAKIKSRKGASIEGGASVVLRTLLPRPSQMVPAEGATEVGTIQRLYLAFSAKLPTRSLRKALAIRTAPLPGVDGSGKGSLLAATQWSLKAAPSDKGQWGYWILLKKRLPKATKVTVSLQLALESNKKDNAIPVWEGAFRTRSPFFLQKIQCEKDKVSIAWGRARYPQENALNCGGGASYPTLTFSRNLGENNPGLLRRMVHISPTVPGVEPSVEGNRLILKGRYSRNTLYRLSIKAQGLPLQDDAGQALRHHGEQSVFFFFGKKAPFLKWERGQGILERFGPQMMPLHSRSIARVDMRIYPISSGDRRFWPFPQSALNITEDRKPKPAGEGPQDPTAYSRNQMVERLQAYIQELGSPRFSQIVPLLADPEGEGHHFGLDLSTYLQPILPPLGPIKGEGKHANQYLVGLRLLDGSKERRYVTIQVTDLSLTAVEEGTDVVFMVTSLKSAMPVANAEVFLEGSPKTEATSAWKVLWKGQTDSNGFARFSLKKAGGLDGIPRRIRVRHNYDQLVLDPHTPPPVFVSRHWWPSSRRWLWWLNDKQEQPKPEQFRAHLFTERPVYRPTEPVHIKGIVRELKNGKLQKVTSKSELKLRIYGPSDRRWEYNVTLTKQSSFYLKFRDDAPPTGAYNANLYEVKNGEERRLASRRFRLEEYRIPQFEVKIVAPERVPADEKFKISALARYYAGGMVVEQPIKWNVVENDISYTPPGRKGYFFASSFRYGNNRNSTSRTVVSRSETLNAQGIAELQLDPTRSLELRPRRYDVEAIVTGTDGRQIANTKSIDVLPSFSVGVKLNNRFRLHTGPVAPEIIAVGIKGQLVKGIPLQVELLRREWHSQLVETDFVQGGVKYRTDVIDKVVASCKVSTKAQAVHCPLKAERSGVYILRVKARDKMGRLQSVSVDMYVRGKQSVAWERPEASVFQLTLDEKLYYVGGKARILVRSPFQKARALVIIEDPKKVRYEWLNIQGGQGIIEVPIQAQHAPNIPVHVLLMRGRVANPKGRGIDPGRPRSVASSINIPVSPRENLVMVALKMPEKARPSQEVEVEITLQSPDKKPVSGEVTLWAVDRAVLSLGREGRLHPIDAFVRRNASRIRLRDTRNLVIGRIARRPDSPGGDQDGLAGGQGMTVRRNFKSVAYYNPAIQVGPSGRVKVRFKLPDDLTTFEVRAVVASGNKRFGFTKKNLLVNLPVMVQRTLPRFVRPGDRFSSGGIARVSEGDGGAATVSIAARGLEVVGTKKRNFLLNKEKAVPVFFDMSVPFKFQKSVAVRLHVQRKKDKEQDAFRLKVPVRPDHRRVYVIREQLVSSLDAPFMLLKKWPEAIRKNSGKIELLVATRSELVRAIAAMEYLLEYPYGCTEQRVSRAFPMVLLESIMKKFAIARLSGRRAQASARSTIRHLRSVLNSEGLYGYWPGSQGNVSLTAYVLPFLIEARRSGLTVPNDLIEKPIQALRRALRSDFQWRHPAYQNSLQSELLHTLALAGHHEPEYLRRLFQRRNIDRLNLFARTRLLLAMLQDKERHTERVQELTNELWARMDIRQDPRQSWFLQGIYFIQKSWYGYYLSSQTRTLAGLLEALSAASSQDPRLDAVKDALLDQRIARRLGYGWREDGTGQASWGSTQDNARALLALRAYLQHQPKSIQQVVLQSRPAYLAANWKTTTTVGNGRDVADIQTVTDALPMLRLKSHTSLKKPIWVRARISYIPQTKGAQLPSLNRGFSVQRSTEVITEGQDSRHFNVKAGIRKEIPFGSILQEETRILTDRYYYHVALEVPLAAGLEIMNPNLKTSRADAKPSKDNSITPTHIEYLDDRVRFFFEVLPAGEHTLYFRTRATTQGTFTYPPTRAELMYQPSFFGRSPGYTLQIAAPQK